MEMDDLTLSLDILSTTEKVNEDVTVIFVETDPSPTLDDDILATTELAETSTTYIDESPTTTQDIDITDDGIVRNEESLVKEDYRESPPLSTIIPPSAETEVTTTDSVWETENNATDVVVADLNTDEDFQQMPSTLAGPTEVPEEYFTTEVMEALTTQEPDFLLEASPTTEEKLDTTSFPLSDITNFDLKITTTLEGLQVDATDTAFDPSQIAKATSYEGSSYPTATRSATVTTTWAEPEEKHINLTNSSGNYSPKFISGASEEYEGSPKLISRVVQENPDHDATHTSDITTTETSMLPDPTTLSSGSVDQGKGNIKDQEQPLVSQINNVLYVNNSENARRTPIQTVNVTNIANNTDVKLQNSGNQTEELTVYEMPLPDINRNSSIQVRPSIVIALCICVAFVLVLAFLSMVTWLCRRHRNRSKVYLSREAAKPRALFTKPMNPVVLPDECVTEAVYMVEFQRPRAPIMLNNDHEGVYFIEKFSRTESPATDETDAGIDNGGFIDIPLSDRGSISTVEDRKHSEPPKYTLKRKQENDADSGIRVWSSTGSLHTASPEVAHCSLPPPPYSPSISKESVCLSVHSLPPLPKIGEILCL